MMRQRAYLAAVTAVCALALSGVVTAVAIQHWAGGAAASRPATLACCLLGVGLCAACGAFSEASVLRRSNYGKRAPRDGHGGGDLAHQG